MRETEEIKRMCLKTQLKLKFLLYFLLALFNKVV